MTFSVNFEHKFIILVRIPVKVCLCKFSNTSTKFNTLIDIFCSKYCQYGNCSGNEKSYSCQCPPGRALNHALNCAGTYF